MRNRQESTSRKLPLVLQEVSTVSAKWPTDSLTDTDPLPQSLPLDEKGYINSQDTGHTAQSQETTDDR
jgi:hypothetical protein